METEYFPLDVDMYSYNLSGCIVRHCLIYSRNGVTGPTIFRQLSLQYVPLKALTFGWMGRIRDAGLASAPRLPAPRIALTALYQVPLDIGLLAEGE